MLLVDTVFWGSLPNQPQPGFYTRPVMDSCRPQQLLLRLRTGDGGDSRGCSLSTDLRVTAYCLNSLRYQIKNTRMLECLSKHAPATSALTLICTFTPSCWHFSVPFLFSRQRSVSLPRCPFQAGMWLSSITTSLNIPPFPLRSEWTQGASGVVSPITQN